ncbi:hypothetical protein TNIN_27681 [Trichonephila inaurata madagascariensis]|uniref:Uncharacterized protein n=1 Tax=Trichonephila inaurata madagascariensis TaxID=2747483 RepID=A0A8X6YJI5_9ARAC|nr:hypothetical protein TNIN_27681 [Trichonephila inaurata madagascariensis]
MLSAVTLTDTISASEFSGGWCAPQPDHGECVGVREKAKPKLGVHVPADVVCLVLCAGKNKRFPPAYSTLSLRWKPFAWGRKPSASSGQVSFRLS